MLDEMYWHNSCVYEARSRDMSGMTLCLSVSPVTSIFRVLYKKSIYLCSNVQSTFSTFVPFGDTFHITWSACIGLDIISRLNLAFKLLQSSYLRLEQGKGLTPLNNLLCVRRPLNQRSHKYILTVEK